MKNRAMKPISRLSAAATAAAALLAATASAQDLPSTVTTPYVEYQRAVEAGDASAALDAARRAFEAGEAERIDRETLGLLAENYGSMAAANGQYDLAFDIWRQAARLGERADIAPADQAWREFNTARAAFYLGRHRDAERFARRARETLEEPDAGNAASLGFPSELHALSALIAVGRSDWGETDRHARAALAAFAAQGRQPDADYAMSHLLAGVAGMLRRDDPESVYHLGMAELMFSGDPDHQALRLMATSLASMARHGVDDVDEGVARLQAADPVYQAHFVDARVPESERDEDAQGSTLELRLEPSYPMELLMAGIEGVVTVRFDVTESGLTENIEVVTGLPAGVFDEAAIDAVAQWRYAPVTQNGESSRREGVITSFSFQIAQSPLQR